jgi:hypothetical protein
MPTLPGKGSPKPATLAHCGPHMYGYSYGHSPAIAIHHGRPWSLHICYSMAQYGHIANTRQVEVRPPGSPLPGDHDHIGHSHDGHRPIGHMAYAIWP